MNSLQYLSLSSMTVGVFHFPHLRLCLMSHCFIFRRKKKNSETIFSLKQIFFNVNKGDWGLRDEKQVWESDLASRTLSVCWACHPTLRSLSEALFSVEVTGFCRTIPRL